MSSKTCPACGIGLLKPTRTVYVQMYEGTLVSAPNVPAWVCDMCGATYFDSPTIQRIDFMVGEAGPPPNHYTPALPADPPAGPVDDADERRPRAKL